MSDLIDRYLAQLRQALQCSSDARHRILCEVEDHLREGAEREEARGAPAQEAQRRAIERFGSPQAVADEWSEVYPREPACPLPDSHREDKARELARRKVGKPMWHPFTERSRRVFFKAQEEAVRLGEQKYVGTEHLLLGLLKEADSAGARLLERLGLSLDSIRRETEQRVSHGPGTPGAPGQEMQLTPPAKRVIDLAYEEARELNNNYLGTEHLVVALVREGESLAGKVLTGMGATAESLRREIRTLPSGDDPPSGGQSGPTPGGPPGPRLTPTPEPPKGAGAAA